MSRYSVSGTLPGLEGSAVLNEPKAQMLAAKNSNIRHFLRNLEAYKAAYARLDSYSAIHSSVSAAVAGIDRLLDIGSGGIFDYDTSTVREITAVDLFIGQIEPGLMAGLFPANVVAKTGDALDLPEPAASFDGALMVMLIHHLVGADVAQCLANTRQALAEAWRVLKPGGRLVIAESCVPAWFYAVERLVFRAAAKLIVATIEHPPTLQYPPALIVALLRELTPEVECRPIPLGRWIIQLGITWPTALTPARAYLFTAIKPLV
jgi:SAM-dependent methyltransferase